jgi:hypothetical protein
MRMRSILVSAVAVAAATAAAVVPTVTSAATASAATNFSVTTHSYGHYDTTSASGNATLPSNNGPVWAIDSLTEKWAVSAYATPQTDGANYSVLLKVTAGSKFSQFANPLTGDVGVGTGKVLGVLQYDVQSSNAPGSQGAIPNPEPANTSLGAVLDQIFGAGQYTIEPNSGNYDFTYNGAPVNTENGGIYQQSSCTGTPHITAAQNPNGTAC